MSERFSGSAVVRMLLAAGAEPDRVDEGGETPLDVARRLGRKRAEAVLADRSSLGWPLVVDEHLPDLPANEGERLLVLAAHHNSARTIRCLVDEGVDPTTKIGESTGRTALHVAAEANAVHAIRALVAAGVDWEGRAVETAFYGAVLSGNAEAVKALLEAGARGDLAVGGWGRNALEEACFRLRELGDDQSAKTSGLLAMTPGGLAPVGLVSGEGYFYRGADGHSYIERPSKQELARLEERKWVRLVWRSYEHRVGADPWSHFATLRLVTDAAGWPHELVYGPLREVLRSIAFANEGG